jgi:hypothetical protein
MLQNFNNFQATESFMMFNAMLFHAQSEKGTGSTILIKIDN